MNVQNQALTQSAIHPNGFIPPKPQDFENGVFPPVGPDRLIAQNVLAITMLADNTLTATIDAGAPFFGPIQLVAYDLTLEPVDPTELPPDHKGTVYQWVYTEMGRSNGETPLPVLAGQQVIVTVNVLVANHELRGGSTFVGEVGLHGAGFEKFVVLTGTFRDQ
ncbi:MAG: hypothetical protein U0350_43155 [Caldilineaceae bacterium]